MAQVHIQPSRIAALIDRTNLRLVDLATELKKIGFDCKPLDLTRARRGYLTDRKRLKQIEIALTRLIARQERELAFGLHLDMRQVVDHWCDRLGCGQNVGCVFDITQLFMREGLRVDVLWSSIARGKKPTQSRLEEMAQCAALLRLAGAGRARQLVHA